MQNSIKQIATKFGPQLLNTTISAIIRLPYQLKRDADGRTVQAKNEVGQLLLDPETRLPMWERESTPPIPDDKLVELKRQIAMAAGIDLAQINEKIEVSQVAWAPPVLIGPGGDSYFANLLKSFNQNIASIVTLLIFGLIVYILYRYATRPIPTEIDDPINQDSLSLAMTQEEDEEEKLDEEWSSLRSKVQAVVQEDPKRAANLLKRWMRKE